MLRRPQCRLTAQVDLYGGTAAAVSIAPAGGRWPENETLDRLSLSVSVAALALRSATRALMPRIRHRVMRVAAALVEAPPPFGPESWAEMVAARRLIQPTGVGQPRITVRLVESRDGPLPSVLGPAPTSLALAGAAATLAGVGLRETTVDVHLSAALSIEGVLLWYRRPGAREGSLQRATLEGYEYAIRRLETAGRVAPESLRLVVSEHRNVRP